jgi:hypothetical protein
VLRGMRNSTEINQIRKRTEDVKRYISKVDMENKIDDVNSFIERSNKNVDIAILRKHIAKGESIDKKSVVKSVGCRGHSKQVLIPRMYCEAAGIEKGTLVSFRIFEGKLIAIFD